MVLHYVLWCVVLCGCLFVCFAFACFSAVAVPFSKLENAFLMEFCDFKGQTQNDESAHGGGMGCLPKMFGSEYLWVAVLCVAIEKRPFARVAQPWTMKKRRWRRRGLPSRKFRTRKFLGGDPVRC